MTPDICPPILPESEFETRRITEDLTGHRQGRFVVIGFTLDLKARWVVKCDCGAFEIRTTKSLKNPNNVDDGCAECRKSSVKRELLPPPEPVPRVHERGNCGKMNFRSEKAAKQAARARMRKGANCDRLRVYFCPTCHQYHMSSTFYRK